MIINLFKYLLHWLISKIIACVMVIMRWHLTYSANKKIGQNMDLVDMFEDL